MCYLSPLFIFFFFFHAYNKTSNNKKEGKKIILLQTLFPTLFLSSAFNIKNDVIYLQKKYIKKKKKNYSSITSSISYLFSNCIFSRRFNSFCASSFVSHSPKPLPIGTQHAILYFFFSILPLLLYLQKDVKKKRNHSSSNTASYSFSNCFHTPSLPSLISISNIISAFVSDHV